MRHMYRHRATIYWEFLNNMLFDTGIETFTDLSNYTKRNFITSSKGSNYVLIDESFRPVFN